MPNYLMMKTVERMTIIHVNHFILENGITNFHSLFFVWHVLYNNNNEKNSTQTNTLIFGSFNTHHTSERAAIATAAIGAHRLSTIVAFV